MFQGPDEERLRTALLKRCQALLARPLAGSAPELLPQLFYDRLRGLERPERDDMLPDSLRERLQSIARQAIAHGPSGARPLALATQVRQ